MRDANAISKFSAASAIEFISLSICFQQRATSHRNSHPAAQNTVAQYASTRKISSLRSRKFKAQLQIARR
ncbi:hypothetical protein CAMGR0001_0094 [Campylobacter gracilis RM3268]|uniref:Uncharacterized protein n=1 Tax=Campylobacter gracilis RM3268 TaxID=553220 RepID=C8PIB3_9BACT|nr:hypothetical protein CAMGR0001_0094 [Campylobacter gracilis RM3268]